MPLWKRIREKGREAAAAVLPIVLTVALLCFAAAPVQPSLLLSFLAGGVLLMAGLALFNYGAEHSMTRMGNAIGARLTRSRKLWLILLLSFVLGVIITMAEPDLQVLAANVPHIENGTLILTVSVGVGVFLALCMLRVLLGIPMKWFLLGFYGLTFGLAALSERGYLALAFDSGGVTTGPMTVPFIMALGTGVASIRSDRNAEADSFGLVGICSIGSILSVLLLGFLFPGSGETGQLAAGAAFQTTTDMGLSYLRSVPVYIKEVALALLPIFAFFLLFQMVSLKLRRLPMLRILSGLLFTYVGLVLFLTGVNVGFSGLGSQLGAVLAAGSLRWLLVPIAMLMGWFIVEAEPAVHVLNRQVEQISAGAVSAKAMHISLALAIALAMGLSMVRVLTGLSILWFLVPGYVLAMGLSFFVPPMFTAIAFDAGGVASGPMTAAFMLPFAIGACTALGGTVMTDAFGLVSMVAMLPLITVQVMGAVSALRHRRAAAGETVLERFDGEEIIELWEVA